MHDLSRRRFLQAAGLLPLAAMLPGKALAAALAAPATQGFEFFDDHQAAVVREATARIIPGPEDDPLEAGHPGAREANVVRYVDLMLAAFGVDPPRIHAGGPWSDRRGGAKNHMASFVDLSPTQEKLWRARIAKLQQEYVAGIAALDQAAGGDFAAASTDDQDAALADAGPFLDLLFVHAIDGTYSIPEYGGNEGLAGWNEIHYPGDSQPRGYTPSEIGEPDGLDPIVLDLTVSAAIENFDQAVSLMLKRRAHGR
jgi:hypothetical protein